MRPRALLVSTVFHAAAIALLLAAAVIVPRKIADDRIVVIPLKPVLSPSLSLPPTKGGGGGEDSPLPARKGKPPERPKARVFVPPMVARIDDPKLVVQPAMLEAPEFEVQLASIGDPLGQLNGDAGRGKGLLGIGDGEDPGIGPGRGGFGGGNDGHLGRISRAPELIYKEEPEYSEEARKARVQGSVTLLIDVGIDGRPANIRIVRGLGLGLDENAVKAVSRWRFRPALSGDRPVAAPARVEIGFRLL